MNHRHLIAALAAFALIGVSSGAQARDEATVMAADNGRWIAAQGNAALVELHFELTRELHASLKPLLPTVVEPAFGTVAAQAEAEPGSLQKVSTETEPAPAQAL